MNTKIVYLFDDSGVYAGTYKAQESPLEPGEYITPAQSTAIPPTPIADGQFAQWDGSAWVVVTPAVDTHPAPVPPTPLEQIRALEAQYADAQAKVTRQSLLVMALDKACADPAAEGMTRQQVHEALMLNAQSGYAVLFALEAQVESLRVQL